MAIGIISDTHDDMAMIKRAVEVFNERKVSHVIHAGDLVSPFTFDLLCGLNCPFTGIFGNNDGDRVLLKTKSGETLHPQPHRMVLEGKRIVVVHEPAVVDALAESGRFDIVIYGHTHTPEVRKVRDALLINPGKAATLHKGRATLAVLETEKMEAEIIEL